MPVKKKKKKRRGEMFIWAAILIVATYAVITLIQLRGQITDAEADLAEKQQMVASLTQENEELAEELEHADDAETKEDIARAKLGLMYPYEQAYDDTGN